MSGSYNPSFLFNIKVTNMFMSVFPACGVKQTEGNINPPGK